MNIYVFLNRQNELTRLCIEQTLDKIKDKKRYTIIYLTASENHPNNINDFFNDSTCSFSLKKGDVCIGDGNVANSDKIADCLLKKIEQYPDVKFILFSSTPEKCEHFRKETKQFNNVIVIDYPLNQTLPSALQTFNILLQTKKKKLKVRSFHSTPPNSITPIKSIPIKATQSDSFIREQKDQETSPKSIMFSETSSKAPLSPVQQTDAKEETFNGLNYII
ncbi:hypothetical protein L3V86_05375 [Thiotrichales bacterium 19S11-10]|nr:hypothetical protein [Thiotrichales bacterium 19S11-10]